MIGPGGIPGVDEDHGYPTDNHMPAFLSDHLAKEAMVRYGRITKSRSSSGVMDG